LPRRSPRPCTGAWARGWRGPGRAPHPAYASIWGGYLVGAILGVALLAPAGLAALALPITGLAVAIVHDLRHPHELARMKQG